MKKIVFALPLIMMTACGQSESEKLAKQQADLAFKQQQLNQQQQQLANQQQQLSQPQVRHICVTISAQMAFIVVVK